MIRSVKPSDIKKITQIYNYYIENTVITFEEQLVSELDMQQRISSINKKYPYLVYEHEGEVVGYAYLNNWRDRSAFNITLENSIYIAQNFIGKKIGSILLKELIYKASNMPIHSLVGAISLPNDASQKLHLNLGFKPVGNFSQVGKKFGKFIDVEFWQLKLR